MLRMSFWWTLVASALLASSARGDLIVPVGQERWVSVYAFAQDFMGSNQVSDSLSASDFGLFQVDTTVIASVALATASGQASQTSDIQGASMQATGNMSADGNPFDYDSSFLADGVTHFEMTFELTEAASFTLSGEIGASGIQCSTTVVLDGPSGPVVSVSARNQTAPILEAGAIKPGTYTLTADSDGRAFGDYFTRFLASGSYDVVFAVTPVTGTLETETRVNDLFAVPNPFREQTTVFHGIRSESVVQASIHDLRGALVRRWTDRDGDLTTSWDGRNDRGEPVRPGVYFVRVKAGDEVNSLKVTRIR